MKIKILYLVIAISIVSNLGFFYKLKHKEQKYNYKIFNMDKEISSKEEDLVKYKNFAYDSIISYESSLSKISLSDYSNALQLPLSDEKIKFCIVVPSYNNISYVKQNINSVFRQNYHNWRMIYIDDASNDGMSELLKRIKKDSNLSDEKFTLKINLERTRSALYNFYYSAHNFCRDDEVLVMLDGDDMLSSANVLTRLSTIYNDSNIWLSYGNQINVSNNTVFDSNKEILASNWTNIRNIPFTTSHLHSVYTWLFKKIKIEDLQYNEKFFSSSWDLAFMFPILEMAGPNRVKAIKDLLYIYRSHPNNDGRLYSNEQMMFDKYIRGLTPYELLD